MGRTPTTIHPSIYSIHPNIFCVWSPRRTNPLDLKELKYDSVKVALECWRERRKNLLSLSGHKADDKLVQMLSLTWNVCVQK